MINNLDEFIDARGLGEKTFQDIERNTYKYTNCGAWIQEEVAIEGKDCVDFLGCEHEAKTLQKGFIIGSIVEGAEDCTPVTVFYPFTLPDFWSAIQKIEDEAEEIWDYAQGCYD